MEQAAETDVVVIGAGLAGLQCARLLAERGHSVVLADRKQSLQESVHTTGIFVRRTLEDFPLPEDCLGPPISNVALYSPALRRMDLVSPHVEFRIGRMGQLYSRMLEQCRLAGVRWLPSTRYAEHRTQSNLLLVRLEQQGEPLWLKTRYIVGADGANSRVARCLGLDTNRQWIVGVEDVFCGVPLDGEPRLHCFLDPRLAPGYLAWVAHDGDEVHAGVGGYAPEFDPTAALAEFRARVKHLFDFSHARHVERRGGRIPVGGILRNICNGQGLLIGDAAGAVSPLTAGGLDPCLRLSTLAANVIDKFLVTNDARVLQLYSGKAFRARFVSRRWLRKMAAWIRHPGVIEVGCASLRLPLLNSFALHVFFGRGSFPDLPEVEDALLEPAM